MDEVQPTANLTWSDIKSFEKPYFDEISTWLSESKIGKTKSRQVDIANEIISIVRELEIPLQTLVEFRQGTRTFPRFKEGNIWLQIENHYSKSPSLPLILKFTRRLFKICPSGMSTSPNAACGKVELLYRLLRPESSQPTRGDVRDEEESIEIKGETGETGGGIRLFGSKAGNKYCEDTIKIFDGKFEGNSTRTKRWKDRKVYEIEKPQHEKHYQEEFSKDIILAKQLLVRYLDENFKIKMDNVDTLFPKGIWCWKELFKLLLRKFYQTTKEKAGFDSLYLFGNGTNLKIIKTEDDLVKLDYDNDYFRIGQGSCVGYYVK